MAAAGRTSRRCAAAWPDRAADAHPGSPSRHRGPRQRLGPGCAGSPADRLGAGRTDRSIRSPWTSTGTGVLYATSTARVNLPLDIRTHPVLGPVRAHAPDRRRICRPSTGASLRPSAAPTNPWLPDANNDGSRDWRDLAQLKERLYRIEDTNGDGVADRSQIMIEGLNEDPDVRHRRRGALSRRRRVARSVSGAVAAAR